MSHCGGSCCGSPDLGAARRFFGKEAARYSRSFQRKGPDSAQRALLELMQRMAGGYDEVLDIGCGVGPIHLSLLTDGAGHATAVDLAAPMLQEARHQAKRLGVSDRAEYRVGDFVQLASELPDADAAVLDKVVCCYEDVDAIVDTSIAKTRNLLALSFPRDIWIARAIMRLVIGASTLFGSGFHPFLHDWRRMKERIVEGGFELTQSAHTWAWQVHIYRRQGAHPAAA